MNITAPINSLGYGVVSLNILRALDGLGCQPALWPIGQLDAEERHREVLLRCLDRQATYDGEAASIRIYHQFDLAQHVGKGQHCALPIFELTRFKPRELNHLWGQDIIYTPSAWAAQILVENGLDADRIHPAPFGVDPEVFSPSKVFPTEGGTPTVFINIGKWELRKGHDVLIEAFKRAFSPQDNVLLLMNCFNPCFPSPEQVKRYNDEWVRLYKQHHLGGKVQVNPERLRSQADVALLMSMADCGVFPSRAEGWGLESAEMLAMGKHVILTDYSAHTEYATDENARLIKIDRLEDAYDGVWFDAGDRAWGGKPGQWAELGESQVDQLVEHMREIHRAKQDGSLGVNEAGVASLKEFTWQETAKALLSPLT